MTTWRMPSMPVGSSISGKIEGMKMSLPFAVVMVAALAAVVAIKAMGGDTSDIMGIVSLTFNAVLLLELREVRNQTNGTTSDLAAENRRLSRQLETITNRALDSGPLQPPSDSTKD